jgi:hypothetical protein
MAIGRLLPNSRTLSGPAGGNCDCQECQRVYGQQRGQEREVIELENHRCSAGGLPPVIPRKIDDLKVVKQEATNSRRQEVITVAKILPTDRFY